jgi:hypothetical protein
MTGECGPNNLGGSATITRNTSVCLLIALSPWAEKLGTRTLQLIEGKGSLGVELGVSHTETLVIVFSGRSWLTGAQLVAVHRRGPGVVKKKKRKGLGVNVSDTSK